MSRLNLKSAKLDSKGAILDLKSEILYFESVFCFDFKSEELDMEMPIFIFETLTLKVPKLTFLSLKKCGI